MLVTPERPLGGAPSRSPGAPASVPPPSADVKVEPLRVARRQAADDFERSYLQRVLSRTDGNVTRAAALAEVSRQMIQKLLKKHALDDKE
jgi:transcriptional regulator with GAF, ATPase, and Fis domain